MRQVQDEELSALLDGELEPQRAAHVRARIEADPALRKEFGALVRLDAGLRGMAKEAALVPDISFPVNAAGNVSALHWPVGAAVVLAVIMIRFLPKLIDSPVFGVGLQVAACAAISFIIIKMAMDPDLPQAAAVSGGMRA